MADDSTMVEAEATSLMEDADLTQNAVEITFGHNKILVTLAAKQSMSTAIDAMSNQPTTYFKCRFAVKAVTDILGVDFLNYSMPQGDELDCDWDDVIPGRKDTYPTGKDPTESEFATVRSVHALVKGEKDEEAKRMGLPKSGVQSYITYKQRWKQWRDIFGVYGRMNRGMDLKVLDDLVMGRLKLCKSIGEIDEMIAEDIKKYKAKLYRESRKRKQARELQEQLAAKELEEEEARTKAEQAEEARAKLVEEQREIEKQVFTGRRSEAAKARSDAMKEKKRRKRESLRS